MPPDACMLDGDRTRLTQVVCNLLGNAIRYTPEGGHIQVALAVHEAQVSLAVSDSGIGIAPHLMPHLFDLYVQAERSADARNGGLGLGLSLVRSLVEIHDGTVSVASAGEGKGSTFTVTLRRAAMP
jgi:signal transduction histidine kinase